jgi:hypothetical protein
MTRASAWSRPVFNLNAAAWDGIRKRNREPIGRGVALRFFIAARIQSALGKLQTRIYQRAVDAVALRAPIFIVGHWRSGTTLLHELLALDEKFAAPTTYECFNPSHFLLTRNQTSADRRAVRPTGDMIVAASSPQEEEFALLCVGAVSPYEAFLFPRAIERVESLGDPDLFQRIEQLRWEQALSWTLKATAFAHGADRRLILKSPTNSFRVGRLAALFPGAAFIRVVREPCAVFGSTLRLWQSMWERYALTAPLAQDRLLERIIEIRLAMERKLRGDLARLPDERRATVRYEDLITDPCGAIARLYELLSLGDPSASAPKVRAYMTEHPRTASDTGGDWRAIVIERWREMFEEFGYPRG